MDYTYKFVITKLNSIGMQIFSKKIEKLLMESNLCANYSTSPDDYALLVFAKKINSKDEDFIVGIVFVNLNYDLMGTSYLSKICIAKNFRQLYLGQTAVIYVRNYENSRGRNIYLQCFPEFNNFFQKCGFVLMCADEISQFVSFHVQPTSLQLNYFSHIL